MVFLYKSLHETAGDRMKFGQLIIGKKSIKIVATRCQILRLKCTKIAPDSTGELTTLPKPLSWNKGDLLKGVQGEEGEEK